MAGVQRLRFPAAPAPAAAELHVSPDLLKRLTAADAPRLRLVVRGGGSEVLLQVGDGEPEPLRVDPAREHRAELFDAAGEGLGDVGWRLAARNSEEARAALRQRRAEAAAARPKPGQAPARPPRPAAPPADWPADWPATRPGAGKRPRPPPPPPPPVAPPTTKRRKNRRSNVLELRGCPWGVAGEDVLALLPGARRWRLLPGGELLVELGEDEDAAAVAAKIPRGRLRVQGRPVGVARSSRAAFKRAAREHLVVPDRRARLPADAAAAERELAVAWAELHASESPAREVWERGARMRALGEVVWGPAAAAAARCRI